VGKEAPTPSLPLANRITEAIALAKYTRTMPSDLRRFHHSGCAHFINFSCYHRQPFLQTAAAALCFESELEHVRRWYGLRVYGYVVMPEHVHLLLSEPERKLLSTAIQMLKQLVSRKLRPQDSRRFWQVRYYDFLLKDHQTHIEKLRYMHGNPVTRGLCAHPEDWSWSSFRHYATGIEGTVEIESEWTGRRRERMGMPLRAQFSPLASHPSTTYVERVGQPEDGE
jgi:putative transposase